MPNKRKQGAKHVNNLSRLLPGQRLPEIEHRCSKSGAGEVYVNQQVPRFWMPELEQIH